MSGALPGDGACELPDRRPGDRFVVLVRHGEAAAGWDGDVDPGLSDLGRSQAAHVAADLAGLAGTPIMVSPLRRTRETAAPIAEALGVVPTIDRAVGEVVAPAEHASLPARGPWLRGFMAGAWTGAHPDLVTWRDGVLGALRALRGDAVVVTHFIAINAAVGGALGDDRVVSFRPANCSRTILRIGDDGLHVVRLGDEAATEVR